MPDQACHFFRPILCQRLPSTGTLTPAQLARLSDNVDQLQGLNRVLCLRLCALKLCSSERCGKCAVALDLSRLCLLCLLFILRLLAVLCLLTVLLLLCSLILRGCVLSGLVLSSLRGTRTRIRAILLGSSLLSGSSVGTAILSALSAGLATISLATSGIGSSVGSSARIAGIGICVCASLQRLQWVQKKSCQRILV